MGTMQKISAESTDVVRRFSIEAQVLWVNLRVEWKLVLHVVFEVFRIKQDLASNSIRNTPHNRKKRAG